MSELFLDGKVTLYGGDNRDVLKGFADNSIDSVVTDPPYALVSITKRLDKEGSSPVIVPEGGSGAYARASSGFMGKKWDTGETAFAVEFWQQIYRVLKPGGHVAAFSGTRTYHRMACAIEDAGFEIRDCLQWIYGSGFPKSHDVSKAIDRHNGDKREQIKANNVRNPKATGGGLDGTEGATRPWIEKALKIGYHIKDGNLPASEISAAWQGFGTALKPAVEPICLARKPLIGTVAANVLEHGTGALNIDGCRIGNEERINSPRALKNANVALGGGWRVDAQPTKSIGRWPANVLLDGSDEVLAGFPVDVDGISASRYFYSSKADSEDRAGSKHPTVKPVDLMQWLCRLITPPGGTVLDPFAGSGSTGEAAWREGFKCVLIEREDEYLADIKRRLEMADKGPMQREHSRLVARGHVEDAGPLFGGA